MDFVFSISSIIKHINLHYITAFFLIVNKC